MSRIDSRFSDADLQPSDGQPTPDQISDPGQVEAIGDVGLDDPRLVVSIDDPTDANSAAIEGNHHEQFSEIDADMESEREEFVAAGSGDFAEDFAEDFSSETVLSDDIAAVGDVDFVASDEIHNVADDSGITAGEQSLDIAQDLPAETSVQDAMEDPQATEVSAPFVGRWQLLVSQTNWEKGEIIQQWRDALQSAGAPVTAFSDEVWAMRVGGVTAQHVGRLRRVYQRFGSTANTYPKLYWSHFLSAMDWDDAEMWLEGATQSGWSVSQMRRQRWEAMNGDPAEMPSDRDIVTADLDEDYSPVASAEEKQREKGNFESGPLLENPDFGDEVPWESAPSASQTDELDEMDIDVEAPAAPAASPFAALPELPSDLADAMEQFKIAIIRHRASRWTEVSIENVVASLEALKRFAQG